MSNTSADRIQRLATKLSSVEAKRNEFIEQYNNIVNEITSILTGEVVDAAKTTMAKPRMKSGELSDKVLTQLNKAGGQTLQEISTKLRVESKRVGLALYHLGRKGDVFTKEDLIFAAPTASGLSVAAKSIPESISEDTDD